MGFEKRLKKMVKRLPGATRIAGALGLIRDYQAEFIDDCYRTTERYLLANPVEEPKGYVVVMDVNHRITTGMMVPISLALLKRGYAVCSAVAGRMPKSALPELQRISGVMSHGTWAVDGTLQINNLVKSWQINWDAGEVCCDGVNYFPFFLERMSKVSKAYRGGLTSKEQINLFNQLIRQSDAILVVCDRLIELAERGKPIRIVAMDTHFAPWGVARRWCDQVGKSKNIHFVAIASAYENYYSNLSNMEASTLTIEDLTANPDLRHPVLGGKRRFERFILEHPEAMTDVDTAMRWIRIDRSRMNSGDRVRMDVEAKAKQARADGRPVFAAFGKVLIDFAAPDDRGHVFDDFPGWMNGLIKMAEQTGCLLVIKPHPHEIREEIVNDGVQVLRDLLPADLPPNVIFLNHDSFNSYELAELVDTSFVWNGTICCEFPILDCPVVAESIWAPLDYPVGLPAMASADQYLEVLSGRLKLPIDESVKARATAFLHFLRSDDVMIPFRYLRRAATNKTIGRNWLYHEELSKLEKHGDPAIERAADRFSQTVNR